MERILVIKLSAFGDFVIALGAMEAIRKHHKNASITLLTTSPFQELARISGYFDEVVVDQRPSFFHVPAWLRLYKFFNEGRFTRVYDLQLNDRTKIYFKLFRRKPEWSGIVSGASHRYKNTLWRQMHAFERHKTMLAELGIEVKTPSLEWMQADTTRFQIKSPYVLLVPGCAPSHPEKRWPAAKYRQLATLLVQAGKYVVLLGTRSEGEVLSSIAHDNNNVTDLCGKTTLYDISALSRSAFGAITNDTGPAHLIALSGCPTLTLFSGSSDPALSAPVGSRVLCLRESNLDDLEVATVLTTFSGLVAN